MGQGYAAQNVMYGMSDELMQHVNRDTMSFATKLSFIQYEDGTCRDVMKRPRTDGGKISLPGYMCVIRDKQGIPMVYPADPFGAPDPRNMLRCIYDCGPVTHYWEDFDTVRTRVREQWEQLPPRGDPLSDELVKKIEEQLYGTQQQ